MADFYCSSMLDNMENFWWIFPQRSRVVPNKSKSVASFWRPPPLGWLKFNVCGISKEDKAGCGGVLRDMEGIARGIFSGAVDTNVAEEAEIGAVKIALELKDGSVVFSLADWNGNDMAFSLALASVNRSQVFKAWW
ncbi:hypothetical protein PVK06_011110 [Gossypium arboreum]|uniref:RNase H type-1 domain-containing protein n=1 Tax=Gossypium arboreum TaxID=29729 RepID=A0ABR0Q854_GOSAR|nr:hypothetical protein PVK06_011110 [Gossypium arboreum]